MVAIVNKKGKTVEPQPFPANDDNYKLKYQITKLSLPYWWYHNIDGDRLILVTKQVRADGKRFQQGTYASDQYQFENIWSKVDDYKFPLFRLHELVKNELPVGVAEGEAAALSAQEKFPNMFWTTYLSGKSSYARTDWSPLKNKTITLLPDVDKRSEKKPNTKIGKQTFEELSIWLKQEYNITANVVNVPTYDEIQTYFKGEFPKKSWDFADSIPKEIDPNKLITDTYLPKPESDGGPYSSIKAYLPKLVYILGSGSRYWDSSKRVFRSKEDINSLFLRAKDRKDSVADKWLHKNNVKLVEGTTFYPSDKQFIVRDEKELLNFYRKPQHQKVVGPVTKEENAWFFNHASYLVSHEEEMSATYVDMFAAAVQWAEKNRRWAVLHHSGQGNGKGLMYSLLEKLVGHHNCRWKELDGIYNKFNSYMCEANNIFVREGNSKGNQDSQAVARIKGLIEAEVFDVEFKGKEAFKHHCHYNFYIMTNENSAMKADIDDRRFWYLKCEEPEKDEKYYDDLADNINNPTKVARLYHYLKHVHVISEDFTYNRVPFSVWKEELTNASMTTYNYELKYLYDNKLIPSFHFYLYNVNQIWKEIREYKYDIENRNRFRLTTEPTPKQIENFLHMIKCQQYRTKEVIVDGKDGKKRKRKVSLAIDPKTKSENYKPRGHYWIDPDHVPYFRKHQTAADYNAHFNDELICARAYKSAPDIKTQKKAILEEPISEEVLFGNDDVPF